MAELRSFAQERFSMVEHQLRGQGIVDEQVLEAMRRLPRHRFLDPGRELEAYAPRAVPIEEGQTLSQPFIVALMTQTLRLSGGEKVLEIGTGTGYQAAVLAMLGAEVFSVERHELLALRARSTLDEMGFEQVALSIGDGSRGWPEHAPYDRILVTAAAPTLPVSLVSQLRDPGILVAPIGNSELQQLEVLELREGNSTHSTGCACRFVPLVGEEGFADEG